jgi:hypothetical protein
MQYEFYIDLGDGIGGAENYVQIIPKSIEPFKITRDKDAYFYRIEFGKIVIADDPELHQISEEAKYAIFLTLQSQYYLKEIRVKVVTDKITVYGYFAHSDCVFDYDRKILEVTPTVLDKYTNLLENWDKEIDFNEYSGTYEELVFKLEYDSVKRFIFAPTLIEGSNPDAWKDVMTSVKNPTLLDAAQDIFGNTNPIVQGQPIDEAWGIFRYFTPAGLPVFENINSDSTYKFQILGKQLSEWETELGRQGNQTDAFEDCDWELSRVKIHYGDYYDKNWFNPNWRRLYLEVEFSREEKLTSFVNELPVDPAGSGWNYRGIKDGKPFYTRKPFNGEYYNAWKWKEGKAPYYRNLIYQANPQTGGYLPLKTNLTGSKYYAHLEADLDYPLAGNNIEIKRSIPLRNFFEHILRNTHEDYASSNVYSTFLWNDLESEMSYYQDKNTSLNYVNGQVNYLNNINAFFKRDLKTRTDENDQEVGVDPSSRDYLAQTTFKDTFDNFNGLFRNQLFWWLDDNLDMHIEHIKYVDDVLKYQNYYDLTTDEVQAPLLSFTQKWSYDKAIHWARIEVTVADAEYVDFTDNYVEFPRIVSNKRVKDKKTTIGIQYFSTDLRYAIENPNDMEDGVILVCVDDEGNVLNRQGIISGLMETNGYLALSNLLYEFTRYEGVFDEGNINGKTTEFATTVRSKLGIELTLKGTVPFLFYGTQLGAGLIDDGTIDVERQYTKIKLRYKYISDALSDQWVLVVQKEDDFEGAENVWHDIANYEI